ncbi:hypothetical protein BU14_0112s0029 [Porphyra umbilicalis]|uniref:Probable ATP-dependent transporter ycf16 n=1 Tax=Porphyra umbilicalis TaxID=2786 RepID=A0A1X6PC61_PORUM|nr:hypothetical protein BU14_0112s0029 [Porphyra umbilicalis]|eukprot:OSX78330.1 hypothetical protein BU14_0112s0029 [Porphyra umbilicalis]
MAVRPPQWGPPGVGAWAFAAPAGPGLARCQAGVGVRSSAFLGLATRRPARVAVVAAGRLATPSRRRRVRPLKATAAGVPAPPAGGGGALPPPPTLSASAAGTKSLQEVRALGAKASEDEVSRLTASRARGTLGALLSYLRSVATEEPGVLVRLLAAITCMIISKLLGISVTLLYRRAVDAVALASATTTAAGVAAAASRSAVQILLAHGVVRVVVSIAHELRNAVFARSGQRLGRRVTRATFGHLHTLESAFHTASRTGQLTRIVDRGTRAVNIIFRAALFSFVPSIFELTLVCGLLARRFTWPFAAVTLATFIVFLSFTLIQNNKMAATRTRMNAVDNEASAKLVDSLTNYETVKTFDNAGFELERYDACLAAHEIAAVKSEWEFAVLNAGQAVIFTAGLTGVLLLAVQGIAAGVMSVGDLVMAAALLQQLWVPLGFLGWQYRELKQSLIDMQNLFDVLARPARVRDVPSAARLAVSGGEVVFENVSFSYGATEPLVPTAEAEAATAAGNGAAKSGNGDVTSRGAMDKDARTAPVVHKVSFRVPAGKTLAIVGSSGSGKSTTLRLLYRLYDLTGGRILIDGQDISKVTQASLREAIGIVSQDTVLFNESLYYNIAYGRPGASPAEVEAAARAAQVHDTIMAMPDGYDTLVGERGAKLSGGERQRVAIARCILKRAAILTLDEASAALDTATEQKVTAALTALGTDRTCLIVAHRLSTVVDADEILVMRNGEVVERGTHADLLVRVPTSEYKLMWARQLAEKTKGAPSTPAEGDEWGMEARRA